MFKKSLMLVFLIVVLFNNCPSYNASSEEKNLAE